MDGLRVDRYPDTACVHACLPACLPPLPDCLAHICIRAERSRAEEHSRRSLWSLSLCLFDAPRGNTPADLGTRRWCWVLSECVCVCVWGGNDVRSREWHCKSVKTLIAVQMSKHTHTCQHGLPYFVKVKCIEAGGDEKAPPRPYFHFCRFSGLSNITPAPTTTTVKQQIYIQPHHPALFSENVISHFRLGSNLRQCTEIICGFWLRVRVLTTPPAHVSSSVSLPIVSRPCPPVTSPPLHSIPPLTSFSSLLFPTCQDDFRLVASGLT